MTEPVNGIYVLQNVQPADIAAAPVAIKVVEMADDSGQLFSAAQVAQMESGGGTVLGYFSIGEAENYRPYFASLPKAAIGPEDPNWPGDYQVKYWTPEWKAVCTSYIDEMIARGYAGAYFDVVDVCDSAWARKNAPGGDAKGAMIDLIESLSAYGKARDPNFKLWVNTSGAEELAGNARFASAIDGALEESLFYLGGRPNPTDGIQYNLDFLSQLVAAGKPVIAVEYVTGAAKVASIQAQAAAAGIGSYIANPNQGLSGVDTEGFATLPPPPKTEPAADVVMGTAGNDRLLAGKGGETMSGLGGNDAYVVTNGADMVVEAAGGGNDTVWSSVDYALAADAQVEALRAQTAAGLRLTGNAYSHTLMGNAGRDTLIGGTGNDTLQGWGGADSMAGGTGNDVYMVDNPGDVVAEAAGGGNDTVWTSVDYALAAGAQVEALRAQTAAGLRLTGNAYSHTLMGNAGRDTLIGGTGNDTLQGWGGADSMAGGTGNDVYMVDNPGDVVVEAAGGGNDTVWATADYVLAAGAQVETLRAQSTTGLRLAGNAYSHTLLGNAGRDTLIGGTGNDWLNGSTGDDVLTGGAGNDVFAFAANFGHDLITDFTPKALGGRDVLDLRSAGVTAANFAGSVAISAASNGGSLIAIGSNTISLPGVAPSALTLADFRLG